jgi:hypothetical protein
LPELKAINAEKAIDQIIKDSSRMRGNNRNNYPYPLSGLLFCGRCGGRCHIKKIRSAKYPDHTYTYITCGMRTQNAIDCGGLYGTFQGRKGAINTRYDDVDRLVMQSFSDKAIELVTEAAKTPSLIPLPENSEVKKLRADILKLEAMNDADLQDAIAKKRAALQVLMANDSNGDTGEKRKQQELIEIIQGSPNFFEFASDEEKKTLYRDYVERIECDRSLITIKLLI